jgi:NAD(P)-dependent dehydrogenase (short-subunit alcohol dehydrogenase family)
MGHSPPGTPLNGAQAPRLSGALLEGRSVVVTGAASWRGIGLACARLMAEHGARVLITDVDGPAAERAALMLPGGRERHWGVRCNVTDKIECEASIALALQHLGGRIDVLVNIAGLTSPQRLLEVTPEMYSLVMDVNMRGTLYMTQAVVPVMRRQGGGSIVNLSSVAAQRGGGAPGGSHYAAAKAAVLGYTKAAARELGPERIRVNAVCPSFIETDFVNGSADAERVSKLAAGIPLGRVGQAQDVAGCVLFLASDLSAYVTGSEIDINGGSHIH